MEGLKKYRHQSNPKEKEMHDKFINEIINSKRDLIHKIIYGTVDEGQNIPRNYLTDNEQRIAITLVQWLGSHVGQCFLKDCGFSLEK